MPDRFEFAADLPPIDSRTGCPILTPQLPRPGVCLVCPPTLGRPGTVCAFTDGSYSPPGKSGYAAVLCSESALASADFKFSSSTCFVIQGGSPLSGSNYTAEAAAVVSALLSVPLNCPLKIYTDALGVMQSAIALMMSTSHRLRLGARSFLVTCRELVALRARYGGETDFFHVRSHTESSDTPSRGNSSADSSAETAANANCFDPDRHRPFLFKEERFVFWKRKVTCSPGWHISGNLRTAVQAILRDALVAEWKSFDHQGELVRFAGKSLVSLLDMVRRTGDTSLLTFLLLVSTKQTPTADRLVWPKSSRTSGLMRCRRCRKLTQSPTHPMKCVYVRHLVRVLRQQVSGELTSLAGGLLASPSLPLGHRSILARVHEFGWYDPTRPPAVEGFPGECDPSLSNSAHNLNSFQRFAGSLGLLPPSLNRILFPNPAQFGARESAHRLLNRKAAEGRVRLQMMILRGTKGVYEKWYGHPVQHTALPRKKKPVPRKRRPVVMSFPRRGSGPPERRSLA
jgi:ribonuclease HI